VIDIAADVISWVCLVLGSFFAVAGGIGLLRLPDFYSRIHGGGVTDTLGAGLVLVGLMFQAGSGLVTVKLFMILGLLLITSPTSTHALAQAALHHGVKPRVAGEEEEPSSD
jgi:multicomponent Na+:H+ antiporter subunit G